MSSVDLNASGCSIAQEALNIIKRLDDKKSGLFYFLLRINMSYKGLYKYNDEKERFETFTFNDKRIEKTKEVEDFDIPKKTKVNNKSNER